MNALATFLGITTMVVIATILNGMVLTVLWGWFIVPIFTLPGLTVAPAIGIALITRYMTDRGQENTKLATKEQFLNACGRSIIGPFMTLFFGWIIHQFM